jgi:CBS domain-containing protein
MRPQATPLFALRADDLMNRHLITLPEDMSLVDAGRLLVRNHIGGAPVVDARGKCVGVLSVVDILRLYQTNAAPEEPSLPRTCSFQAIEKILDGRERVRCLLPPGVCPIQTRQAGADDKETLICNQPHCVLVDWQMVDVEKLPRGRLRRYMTPDPVTSTSNTSIRVLARTMIDAHIHRIIIVDEGREPIGIVSSTDLLAALAEGAEELQATSDQYAEQCR